METLIKNKEGISFQVVLRDRSKKIAVLKQVSHIAKVLMYGGQYVFVKGNKSKNGLTLESATELYNESLNQ